jgi:flagellar hook protein FlgE
MMTAMGNGTSALLAMQKAMAVESNNAGNAESLAFKTDTVSFSDMFYSQSVGLGVGMNNPIKDFSQGELMPTNSEFDFAILGEGFFTLYDPLNPDQTLYSRAGQFKSDANNLLTDNEGNIVLGYRAVSSGDIITSLHSENVATYRIETEDKTTTINTYVSDYEQSIEAIGSLNSSGDGYKTSGTIIGDIEELLYQYSSALKTYSTDPERIPEDTTTKAVATLEIPTDNIVNDEFTLIITIDGVKFQQDFDESIENTLKLFSDQLSGFTGITSSVDTSASPAILTVESMVPGKTMSAIGAQVNGDTILIDLEQATKGFGLELSGAIYSEIESIFAQVNGNLLSGLQSNYASKTDQDKYFIYDRMSEDDKTALYALVGEDRQSVVSANADKEENAFYYLLSTYPTEVDGYLETQYIALYDEADIAQNFSTIDHLEPGPIDPGSMEQILLDLNALGLNSTLYDKLLNQGDDGDTLVAAYPGLESDDGMLYLTDGEARFLVGYIAPVTFSDKTLLKPEGNNLYTITASQFPAGQEPPVPVYVDGTASIESRYLEQSNVDIAEQLVNLLAFQKAFEANSKSITTSDEMMKTALALKTQ